KLNYRSSSSVIKFNNSLFHHVMPLGPGFKGVDKHAVAFEAQDVPPTCEKTGQVKKLLVELERPNDQAENKKWPNNQELNRSEAYAIAKEIDRLLAIDSNAQIAILYSKLTPSFELINLLMKEERNFKAQVK